MKRVFMVGVIFLIMLVAGFSFYFFEHKNITGNVVDGTFVANSVSCTDSDGGVFSSSKGSVMNKNFLGITQLVFV